MQEENLVRGMRRCIIFIIACCCLYFTLAAMHNIAHSSEWNSGKCEEDNIEYEYRGAGRYGVGIYVCPECQKVIKKF